MTTPVYEKLALFLLPYARRFGWTNTALLVLSLALLPFLILAAYCHPSADDFWLTNMVIEKGPWQAQINIRQNWSGRYTAMFLGSYNPLVYRSFTFYKILPVLFLFSLTSGLYWLITLLTQKQFPRRGNVALALAFLIIYLHQMHTVAQTIYWMSGALTYQAANILFLFFATTLLYYYQLSPERRTIFLKIIITLLLTATIGCNETTMGIMAFLLSCFLLSTFIWNRPPDYFIIWLFIVTVISCGLVILAPGNAVRAQEYPTSHDFGYALFHALVVPVNNSLNWFINSPLLLISSFLILSVARWLTLPQLFEKIPPLLALLIWYGCLASGYFVAYWSKHGPSPPRAQDTIYLFFLIGWFVNLLILISHIRKRYVIPAFPSYVTYLLLIWGIAFTFYSKQSNIRTAYIDLLSGQATRYNQEMQARYVALKSNSCEVCPIQAAKNRPKTIFFEEVTPDTTWENTFYARYFGKKLLLVSE